MKIRFGKNNVVDTNDVNVESFDEIFNSLDELADAYVPDVEQGVDEAHTALDKVIAACLSVGSSNALSITVDSNGFLTVVKP